MCDKNEIGTKVLPSKSSNFSKFYPNPLNFSHAEKHKCCIKKHAMISIKVLAQTNKKIYEDMKVEKKIPGTLF